ncbi:hypothetical protein FRC17_001652, partial [Serendipita sp. 399]
MATHTDEHSVEDISEEGSSPDVKPNGETRVVITGFGPFMNIRVNPSFQINQALPSTLTVYRNKKPQNIILERYPEAVHVGYEHVLGLIPQIYDQYAGGSPSPTSLPFFIHIGAGSPGHYEVERLAHRDGYTFLDVDNKTPPLQNAAFLAGSRVSNQQALKDDRSIKGRGFPVLDNAETLQTGIDVQGVVEDVRGEVKDLTMPIMTSNDPGRFLCDFIYYSSLHEAAARFGDEGLKRVLFVHVPPNGTLEEGAKRWNDTGSSTLLATGYALKSGSQVLAKIAPAHSNSAICLGREVVINDQLSSMPEGTRIALSLVEAFSIPKSAGDCEVVIYLDPGTNALGRYFPPGSINDLLLPWDASMDTLDTPVDPRRSKLQRNGSNRNIFSPKTTEFGDDENTIGVIESTEDSTEKAGTSERADTPMEVDGTGMDPSTPLQPTTTSVGIDEYQLLDMKAYSNDAWDIMDLASFLEFAINSTHCLEILHKSGHKHREVRANAFHVSIHSGAVRFAHFGNRSESLEKTGGPSQLVLRASGLIPDEDASGPRSDDGERGRQDELRSENGEFGDTRKVKEAICYLAPEQTGTAETNTEDHRTDLYALGILFWTMAVGNGALPFDGNPVEMLHKVVQSKPREVHEVRRDIPIVLSSIISKLLSKSPDLRYNSAIGLKNDLMECQKRLTLSCASMDTPGNALISDVELIPPFDLGQHDMFLELTIPGDLFGREKEMQEIRTVIRNVATAAVAQVHTMDTNGILLRANKIMFGQSTVSFAAPSNASTSSLVPSNVSVGYSNASF